jgi:hypothetical protein
MAITITNTATVPIEVYGSRILVLATLGQRFVAGPWEVTIANVSEGPCLKVYSGFRFEEELKYHRAPLIATDAGNTFWRFEDLQDLEHVKSSSEAKALDPLCIAVRNMFPSTYILRPGEVSVESMVFVVPKDEKPVELLMIRMLKDPRPTPKQ